MGYSSYTTHENKVPCCSVPCEIPRDIGFKSEASGSLEDLELSRRRYACPHGTRRPTDRDVFVHRNAEELEHRMIFYWTTVNEHSEYLRNTKGTVSSLLEVAVDCQIAIANESMEFTPKGARHFPCLSSLPPRSY
ncbi:hypothetical protein Tco_0415404 [Tanacetum coccineum]